MRDIALRIGPSFLVNVALDDRRRITGVFAGDLVEAHRVGVEFVRRSSMTRMEAPFDVVVTTDSGAPLDLNPYQGVKGIAAAARIVRDRGTIVLACECAEGVPAGSPFERLLRECGGPDEILLRLATPGSVRPEQWQAQILAQVLRRARVLVHSTIADDVLRPCHVEPCRDIGAAVRDALTRHGPAARIAVLPQGPLTIPWIG